MNLHDKADIKTIAICGAGIAGIATAYYLLKMNTSLKVILIDKNQPLSFTTSKSGENFRDYWPQKCMMDFASHSIDLMKQLQEDFGEESFEINYSGYDFITFDSENAIFSSETEQNSNSFIHEELNQAGIRKRYPYLSTRVEKVVTIKKAGSIDVYAMGSLLFREAKKLGATFIQSEIKNIDQIENKFSIQLDTESIQVDKICISAGPFINDIAKMLGLNFPVENILQQKFIIPDPKNIIPKDMPFTIYADQQYLEWSEEEKEFFSSDENYKWLLDKFPGGLHVKPTSEGIKLGWAFNVQSEDPKWEPNNMEIFPQVVLKGASRFIPELAAYENAIPTPIIRYGGYYTRTKENWPLIGSTKNSNVFVVGALAGYGTMSACAAGELCAQYITKQDTLPSYASYFHPQRYESTEMLAKIEELQVDGQL
ncbi:NAD(P)/FAD-dependent oxidoreductase [Cellulophaga sp. Z1A5H]|uniref:NAD(P)/FAD-dependent oxidoreductase n=1 Tax=Cellulophaga sp. Z1A5H TaxID=2687291 RepID=UPI0013FDB333|nr:FAD-dependent oxidoreductase [Cellulophaga sp. Z1A5H]